MKKAKRKNLVTIVIAVVVAVCIFCICNSSAKGTYEFSGFEDKIREDAESVVEHFNLDTNYKNLEFVINQNKIQIYDVVEKVGELDFGEMPQLFEELLYTEAPKLLTTGKVSRKLERLFDSAKEIVCQYVSQSSIIKNEDKEQVQNAISNVKLVVGEFEADYEGYGMITHEDTIYVESNVAHEIQDEYIFIHELIHVINAVTAKGSKYENTYLNQGCLSEGITDLIAVTMTDWCGIDSKAIRYSGYLRYFNTVYVLMSNEKFDLLEAYYYPDNYDKLIEMAGENFTKCIFTSVFVLDRSGYARSNYLASNYYLQLEE